MKKIAEIFLKKIFTNLWSFLKLLACYCVGGKHAEIVMTSLWRHWQKVISRSSFIFKKTIDLEDNEANMEDMKDVEDKDSFYYLKKF